HAPQPLPAGTPEPPLGTGTVPIAPPLTDVIISPGPTPVPLMPGDPTFNQLCDDCGLAGPGDCGSAGICCGDDCSCCCCDCCCQECCPAFKWWLRGEYLMWWMRDMKAPPLVTSGPQESFGVIGRPGTSITFGGPIDFGTFNGARVNAGF